MLLHLFSFAFGLFYSMILSKPLQRDTLIQWRSPKLEWTYLNVLASLTENTAGGPLEFSFMLFCNNWIVGMGYMFFSSSARIVALEARWTHVVLFLLAIDAFMYVLHRFMHYSAYTMRMTTHHGHHAIISPTALNATMGNFTESFLLFVGPNFFSWIMAPFVTYMEIALSILSCTCTSLPFITTKDSFTIIFSNVSVLQVLDCIMCITWRPRRISVISRFSGTIWAAPSPCPKMFVDSVIQRSRNKRRIEHYYMHGYFGDIAALSDP